MKPLLSFALVAIMLVIIFSYQKPVPPSVRPVTKDTFRYFRTIDEHTLATSIDSLYTIVYPKVGRSLPAEQADAYQALMYRVLVRLSNMGRDSVRVK